MATPKTNQSPTADEDLFDFATPTNEAEDIDQDELDVEQFLAAVGAATEEQQRDTGLGVSDELLREMEALQQSAAPKPGSNSPASTAPAALRTTQVKHVTVAGAGLPRPVWIAGLALLAINALGFGFALLQQKSTSGELEQARLRLEAAAAGVGEGLKGEIARFDRNTAQATSAALESGVSLDHVLRSLDDNDFKLARRQVYSLLSTIDRLPPERRQDLEARANFLLADSYRREGLQRASEEARR